MDGNDLWALQQDMTDIANEHSEDHPNEQIYQWLVTSDEGQQFFVYGSAEAMGECENTLSGIQSIKLITDNDAIAVVNEQSTPPPQLQKYEGEHRGRGRSVSRNPQPRHGKADVLQMNDPTNYAKHPGEPLLPFGYETQEQVTRLPQHAKPRPRRKRKKPPPPGMRPYSPEGRNDSGIGKPPI